MDRRKTPDIPESTERWCCSGRWCESSPGAISPVDVVRRTTWMVSRSPPRRSLLLYCSPGAACELRPGRSGLYPRGGVVLPKLERMGERLPEDREPGGEPLSPDRSMPIRS